MKKITVNCKETYDVLVGSRISFKVGEILKKELNGCCKIVVVTDSLVYRLYWKALKNNLENAGFLVFVFILPNGEVSKNFYNVLKFYSFLFNCKISKKDLIISFGGGMVLDFGGFCAATYLRGIKVVNLPTTLLAQVDACIGGKSAVNLKFGKNLVGTIKSPFMVICDIFFLKSLSKRAFNSGVSEIIKYAVTFSKNLYNVLANKNIYIFLENIVFECLKIKKSVVEEDEYEKNIRMKLNFGHTIGHAIEKISNYRLYHGEAVAIGMSYITEKSSKFGFTDYEDFLKLKFLLEKYSLPTKTNIEFEEIFKKVVIDKKVFGDIIKFCIIENIGSCKIMSFTISKFKEFIK